MRQEFRFDTNNPEPGAGCRGLSLLALASGAVALALAATWAREHPTHPAWALAMTLAVAIVAACRPRASVGVWAALLPLADQGLQTGPWTSDGLDLLVLACVAGCSWALYRRARCAAVRVPLPAWRWVAFGGLTGVVMVAGWLPVWLAADAPGAAEAWRLGKVFLWAAWLLPLWWVAHRGNGESLARAWVIGHALGLAVVTAQVLIELTWFAGLPVAVPGYRSAAGFWEMRLGGGAIDVYLAVTLPLVVWALIRERRALGWWALALLLVLAVQVLVSTQSRALIATTAVSVTGLGLLSLCWRDRTAHRPAERSPAWNHRWWGFLGLVAIQLLWGVAAGSGWQARLSASAQDMGSRVAHWTRALDTLQGHERWWGMGAGQLPGRYGAVPGPGEFPGQLHWRPDAAGHLKAWLSGPVSDPRIGPLFALSQRFHGLHPGDHSVRWRLTVAQPTVLLFGVCERHVIYDRRCQWHRVQVAPGGQAIAGPQSGETRLEGSPFDRDGPLAASRPAMFTLSVLTPGAEVRVDRLELIDARGAQRLRNPDFAQGAQRWVATAQGRFEPWHVDNLYLEFYLERGLPGLLALLALMGLALWAAWRAFRVNRHSAAVALGASAGAVALLGLLISAAELPRLMLLVWLTLGICLQLRPKTSHIRRM